MKELSLTYYVKDYTILSGKLLGFIDRSQFYRLYNSPGKFARKIGSGDIKTLRTISEVTNYKKHRLVFSTYIQGTRYLLVTGEIKEMDTVMVKKEIALNILDADDNFIYIDEEKDS